MRPLLFLALVACAPSPECESACGIVMTGGDCDTLNRAEYLSIRAFNKGPYYGRSRELCQAIANVHVSFSPGMRAWALSNGNEISIREPKYLGYYLPHELGHIWQRKLEGNQRGSCGESDLPCHLDEAVERARAMTCE